MNYGERTMQEACKKNQAVFLPRILDILLSREFSSGQKANLRLRNIWDGALCEINQRLEAISSSNLEVHPRYVHLRCVVYVIFD